MKLKRSTTNRSLNRKQVIRLADRDRQLILVGLNWIVANFRLRNQGHHAPSSLERVWASRFEPGVFHQSSMDSILALRTALSSLGVGGRLRLETSFEIAACALAVRIALKRQRHGHVRLEIPGIDTASKRLLGRLETVRKRAKRTEVTREGLGNYQRKAREWKEFVRWLRVHIPNCNCRRRQPTRGNHRRAMVDQLVTWTREELKGSKAQIPDDRELRRLVRLQLRYIRRGRTGFGIRDLMNDKGFAAIRLAAFVSVRTEKYANWGVV